MTDMVWTGAMLNRYEKLKALEADLLELMKKSNSRTYAALAKQYRETLREIEEIEGAREPDDEIGEILQGREADGKPGSVRKNRAKVQRQ